MLEWFGRHSAQSPSKIELKKALRKTFIHLNMLCACEKFFIISNLHNLSHNHFVALADFVII